MGKKNNKKKTTTTEPERETKVSTGGVASGGAARWVAIGLLLIGTGFFVYASFKPGASPTPAAATSTATAATESPAQHQDPGQAHKFRYFENPEEAHPLPVTLPPSEFKNQGIANTYQIAKEIPEVLAQQPCLCGCDSSYEDHRSLLDCYRDEHASTCMVCMKEAVLASKMTKEGHSAREIRDAILRHDYAEVPIGN